MAVTWREAKQVLGRLIAQLDFGLFSDLDGTLAPIAPTPDTAQLSPRIRDLLTSLRDELPLLALVSGRRAASLQEKVGIPGITYVGNHGLEHWENGETLIDLQAIPYLEPVQEVKRELLSLQQEGCFVEDKEVTLSFHYRQAADPAGFVRRHRRQIQRVVDKHGLALFMGKMVFEVRPPIEMDKGIAFSHLVGQHHLQAALFMGDDITDLSAMQAARGLRKKKLCDAWSAGVQSEDAPEALGATADFLADGVGDVEELLSWLSMARKASFT